MQIKKRIGVLKDKEISTDKNLVDLAQWRQESDNPKRYALHVEYDQGAPTGVIIHPPFLVRLLRNAFRSFPGAIFGKSFVSIDEPYALFYHHWDEILGLAKYEVVQDNRLEKQPDIEAVQLLYQEYGQRDHEKIRQNIELNAIGFEDLWALYRPCTILYSLDSFNEPQLYYTLGHRYKRVFVSSTSDYEERCTVDCWHVTWDESVKMLTRTSKSINITEFRGTGMITSLQLYPLAFYPGSPKVSKADLENVLEERCKLWKDSVSSDPTCYEYSRPVQWITNDPSNGRHRVEDELEPVAFLTPSAKAVPVSAHAGRVILDQTSTNVYEIGRNIEKPHTIQGILNDEYGDFDAHPPSKEFTKLQAQLCPSFLAAFSLKMNRWCLLLIDHLMKTMWNTGATEHLVMEQKQKTRLQGLVTQHSRDEEKIMGDGIDSKGRVSTAPIVLVPINFSQ